MVATETSLPGVTLGHLAMAEKQYLGLTFLQVIVVGGEGGDDGDGGLVKATV